ncbi:hypothetical protein [Pseudomonas putida]
MINVTPAPPDTSLTTAFHPFAPSEGEMPILAVREGMPLEEVLIHASGYLRSASAGAAEMVENCPVHLRPLARNIEHLAEIARALVEASITGLPTHSRPQ